MITWDNFRPHERTVEDLEIIYEELLHIKALSHLSTMVKRELASVLVFRVPCKSWNSLYVSSVNDSVFKC